jgi:hypothetical protein
MDSMLKFLTWYKQEGDEFLDSIVTGDYVIVFFLLVLGFGDYVEK